MGCRGSGPGLGSLHTTDSPKPRITLRNLSLMAEDVCVADISKSLIYFLDCASSISTLRKRFEELKTCSGNEEPANSPTGEDDYGARKTGELSFLLQRRHL